VSHTPFFRTYIKKRSLAGALCASDQLLAEAVAAVNRTVGTGLERNLAGFAAACAGCVIHLAVAVTTGRALLASRTARFAALGFIGETLFRVEFLLAGGEGEAGSAIFADDGFVAEHEIPLSFFDGFGSGVPVQSHSSFVNGCILAWVGGLRLWKKRKRIVCFREIKMPSTLSICRVDLRQCALIKKHMRPIIK
jgi:hypothetical protein